MKDDAVRAIMYCWKLFLEKHFKLLDDTADLARSMHEEFCDDTEYQRFVRVIRQGVLTDMDDRQFIREGDGIHRFTGMKESLEVKMESMSVLLQVLDRLGDLVDVGGGKADLSIFLLKQRLAASAIVVEPSEFMRVVAKRIESKEESGVKVISGLMQEIPLSDSCADTVVCIDVLEWSHEQEKGLYEMARLLRPGGRLFITCCEHGYRGELIPFPLLVEILRSGNVETVYLGQHGVRHYILGAKQ